MKVILSLIAVAALSCVTSLFAQDEETPSPSPDEKASATVEAQPAPTATPEESKAPKKEETSTTKSESSTTAESSPAAQKKETTTATATKSSTATSATKSAAPASSTAVRKGMSVEATLKEMENKWEAAYAAHDVTVPQAYVASDFVGVSPKYKFTNKSSLLSEFKKDKDTYQSTKNESLKVTSFGPNVAVVTGRAREKGTGKDGKAFDRTYYFTDTWMQRGGQWQCIASQASEMKK